MLPFGVRLHTAKLGLALVAISVACAGSPEHSSEADSPRPAASAGMSQAPKAGTETGPIAVGLHVAPEPLLWREQVSNAGNYLVRWCTLPEPLPLNEPFEVRVQLFRADGEPLPEATCRVAVDAAMPHHGHGMNVQPELIPNADGSHSARGMLFHMGGAWTLYFDITEGGITERAQTIFEL